LKVTILPALALSEIYHVEVARSDLHLLCVCARARACVCACVCEGRYLKMIKYFDLTLDSPLKATFNFLNGTPYFSLHILTAHLESFPKHYNYLIFVNFRYAPPIHTDLSCFFVEWFGGTQCDTTLFRMSSPERTPSTHGCFRTANVH
jgi:hypothetical protein